MREALCARGHWQQLPVRVDHDTIISHQVRQPGEVHQPLLRCGDGAGAGRREGWGGGAGRGQLPLMRPRPAAQLLCQGDHHRVPEEDRESTRSSRLVWMREITYDYKFPLEDNKIPCLCGTESCGSLN